MRAPRSPGTSGPGPTRGPTRGPPRNRALQPLRCRSTDIGGSSWRHLLTRVDPAAGRRSLTLRGRGRVGRQIGVPGVDDALPAAAVLLLPDLDDLPPILRSLAGRLFEAQSIG